MVMVRASTLTDPPAARRVAVGPEKALALNDQSAAYVGRLRLPALPEPNAPTPIAPEPEAVRALALMGYVSSRIRSGRVGADRPAVPERSSRRRRIVRCPAAPIAPPAATVGYLGAARDDQLAARGDRQRPRVPAAESVCCDLAVAGHADVGGVDVEAVPASWDLLGGRTDPGSRRSGRRWGRPRPSPTPPSRLRAPAGRAAPALGDQAVVGSTPDGDRSAADLDGTIGVELARRGDE